MTFARRQIRGMEVARIDHSGRSFAPHFHDEFVLSVNVQGHERLVLDGVSMEAGAGDVTLYNPAQVQSSEVVGGDWNFLSLYITPERLAVLCGVHADTIFEKSVLKQARAAGHLQAAIETALSTDISDAQAEERLVQVLDQLLSVAGSRHAPVSRYVPDAVARVADRLRCERDLPGLAQLAQAVDLTPVQLVRAFTRTYGLPPFTWAWNRRVQEARLRISRGEDIVHVAMDLGFADQAHLTRRFRALLGVPPGRWARG